MPYIRQEYRAVLDQGLDNPQSPGDLNYMITRLIQQYIKDHGGPSYTTYNEIIGVLECAKLELYRRKVSEYEDIKINENGDVYG